MTDNDQNEIGDQWDACPAGEIQQMVRRERSRRTTKKLSRAASATGVVAVFAIAVFVGGRHWLEQQPANPAGGAIPRILAAITCEEVVGHLPAYVNDTLHREDPNAYEAVFNHLQHCRECEEEKRKLIASQSALGSNNPSVAQLDRNLPSLYARQIR